MQTSTSSLLARASYMLRGFDAFRKPVDFDGLRNLQAKINALPNRSFDLNFYMSPLGDCGCALGWAVVFNSEKETGVRDIRTASFELQRLLSGEIGMSRAAYHLFGMSLEQATELFSVPGQSPFDFVSPESYELLKLSRSAGHSERLGKLHKKTFNNRMKHFMEKYDVRQPVREQPAVEPNPVSTSWTNELYGQSAARSRVVRRELIRTPEPRTVSEGERIHADVAALLRECSTGLRGGRQHDRQGSAPSRRVAAERAEVA